MNRRLLIAIWLTAITLASVNPFMQHAGDRIGAAIFVLALAFPYAATRWAYRELHRLAFTVWLGFNFAAVVAIEPHFELLAVALVIINGIMWLIFAIGLRLALRASVNSDQGA